MEEYLALQYPEKGFGHLPIAVCINKVDTLAKYDDRWGAIIRDYTPDHNGYCDVVTCHDRSNAIEELMLEHPDTGSACVHLCEGFPEKHMFFTVATIGSDDAAGRFLTDVCRRSVPLWAHMDQMTMIKGRR